MESRRRQGTDPKRRRRTFWLVIVGIIVVLTAYYVYRDRPAKYVQTENFEQVDYEKGELVDYRYAFNALQEKNIAPVEENGWRLILQKLGPRALDADELASSVPWEEFPTHEKTKEWFGRVWTPLCEKFELEPTERPEFLDRMTFWNYVGKYGFTGDEPDPEEGSYEFGYYWENYEKRPKRVKDDYEAFNKPWTAEDAPVAARWIEDNADVYEVLTQAARFPRLNCWHMIPEPNDGGFVGTLLPDVQKTREFARLFAMRANLRVGSGNVDGAIDDVETIALYGRALLENETGYLIERLVGIAVLGIGAGVSIFGNSEAPPTAGQIARVKALKQAFYEDAQVERFIEIAQKGEEIFRLGVFEDILTVRRNGHAFDWTSKVEDDFCVERNDYSWFDRMMIRLFFLYPPVDDAKAFRFYKDMESRSRFKNWAVDSDPIPIFPSEKRIAFLPKIFLSEAWFFLTGFDGEKEFYRFDCFNKESTLALAIRAYETEHGTLPPAFTVDENGAPLHSWRVLILPFLGESERRLYDQLRLDEPWDSEANRAFWSQIPEVYRCNMAKNAKDGETIYSVLLGENGFFDASGQGKSLDDLRTAPDRDLSGQYLIVERAEPVCWMKPDSELQIDDFRKGDSWDLEKFFEKCRHDAGVNVAFMTGSVRFVHNAISNQDFGRALEGTSKPEEEAETR